MVRLSFSHISYELFHVDALLEMPAGTILLSRQTESLRNSSLDEGRRNGKLVLYCIFFVFCRLFLPKVSLSWRDRVAISLFLDLLPPLQWLRCCCLRERVDRSKAQVIAKAG